ncbi:50S ribosomal protein L4 [Candidatus Malacoplasma girerdii]|uniref:Large ribosomal subunit protein uL4 n=1 Tax=Candidatus Malacoplasma girerdii TaxID=1318617 RepID=A0A097SS98_9BACT|nr:50S ribosomal protein L4 [Candidatus Malacoplasma girerdii]ASJ88981.1 MAG: 50S ribosomal protein L4 [Candidatus Malacoplasma girerdii]
MSNQVKLVNIQGEIVKECPFSASLITKKISKQAMFDAVVAENNAMRQGTHSTLTKAEVRGGGRKPFAQKHTGNARQGSIRNPQWVGGGIVFGPKPNRNYKNKVNKKVIHLAFKSALTLKLNDANIYLLESVKMAKPNTKMVSNFMKKLSLAKTKTLFVLANEQENLLKSIRNIDKANVKLFNQVSTKDIMNAKYVVMQLDAMENLGKVYK